MKNIIFLKRETFNGEDHYKIQWNDERNNYHFGYVPVAVWTVLQDRFIGQGEQTGLWNSSATLKDDKHICDQCHRLYGIATEGHDGLCPKCITRNENKK
jgi:hypothetical protein